MENQSQRQQEEPNSAPELTPPEPEQVSPQSKTKRIHKIIRYLLFISALFFIIRPFYYSKEIDQYKFENRPKRIEIKEEISDEQKSAVIPELMRVVSTIGRMNRIDALRYLSEQSNIGFFAISSDGTISVKHKHGGGVIAVEYGWLSWLIP